MLCRHIYQVQGRTQDFFKGGVLKYFAPDKVENRFGRKVAQWGGGGGGGVSGHFLFFLGGPRNIAMTQPAEKSLSGGGGVSGHFFFFFLGLELSKLDIIFVGGGGKVNLFRLAVGIIFFFFFFV